MMVIVSYSWSPIRVGYPDTCLQVPQDLQTSQHPHHFNPRQHHLHHHQHPRQILMRRWTSLSRREALGPMFIASPWGCTAWVSNQQQLPRPNSYPQVSWCQGLSFRMVLSCQHISAPCPPQQVSSLCDSGSEGPQAVPVHPSGKVVGSGLFCGCERKEGGWAWSWIIIVDLRDTEKSVFKSQKAHLVSTADINIKVTDLLMFRQIIQALRSFLWWISRFYSSVKLSCIV